MVRHAWLIASLVSGCAGTDPGAARDEVADILAARGGPRNVVVAHDDAEGVAAIDARIDALLSRPLTVDVATEVALLGNRELLATFEDLGIGQADLVQAGLLANPTIGGDLVGSTRGNGLGGGLSLSQSLLSAFLIPARKRVAKAELQRAVLTVADAASTLVRDVKIAYADVQAAVARRDLHRTLAQTAEVADDLARRLSAAGNLHDLDRELFAADLDAARLDLADAELDLVSAREHLNRLLGLWGDRVDWRLASPLPEPPGQEADLARLEQVGIAQRLDLSAARATVESIEHALALRRRGLVPAIDAGVEARNEVGDDAGHEWVVGPSLSIELPIFDPGHADLARIGAMLRQAQHRVQAMAIDARADIREERAALVTARSEAEYLRDTVLPRRTALGRRALERYNAMLIGAHELLEIRAEQAHAHLAYVDARHDYWVARAELEWAVGGRLPE